MPTADMATDEPDTERRNLVKRDSESALSPDTTQTKHCKPQVAFNSHACIIYVCLLILFLVELLLTFGLYLYISHVDARCVALAELSASVAAATQAQGPAVERYHRKRRAAVVEDNTVNPASGADANVEFFNPKLRQELEDKDMTKKKAGGGAGEGETANNPWVWLTSYSRIPLVAIQGFCSATRDYCPPGPPGSPGLPGSPGQRGGDGNKGDRGDRGFPGEEGKRGSPGIHGEQGPRGPEGEGGQPGAAGLDGRDGVPGEPGLDGIPGRNGLDGLPGMDGSPGFNGMPGMHGTNGTDGRPGLLGPIGPMGPKGPRGLSGPRGRPGKSGINGMPGIPGINAWTVKINGTPSNELLIPPSIAGSSPILPYQPQVIIVREGDNVRLRCAATGTPYPSVEWRKLDGSPIPLGSWQAVSVSGHSLNITRINRGHMGSYLCIADNGIPPQANQTFQLEVHFPPLIRIQSQMVGAANGSTATLECEVEAYPEAIRYWERADGRLLEPGDKYRMHYTEHGRYKARMQLNITRVGGADFGMYHCICKNELGITKGIFTVFEIDPRLAKPPTVGSVGQSISVFGDLPPDFVDFEELCPPAPTCPECPDQKEFKCQDGGLSLFNLVKGMEIRPFDNVSYPGLPNRTLDCQLYAVGKPVYHQFTNTTYGSWMRDSLPRIVGEEKFWVTKEDDWGHLYEYANKSVYRKNIPSKTYTLEQSFKGNAHVVYNGSFFYNERDRPRVIKFDLTSSYTYSLDVPLVATNGTNFLYTTEYNYMDFSVDDNGLWVIYGLSNLNNTIVMKVDANSMQTQYMWNISVNHHKVGEMFIVCGVLYAVDSCTERNTKIRFALDLYKNQLLDVNLAFTNPFRRTTMIGYNHRNKELYTWDRGNQLTYPIRYHEIGYNSTKEEKADPEAIPQVQTGYDVYN